MEEGERRTHSGRGTLGGIRNEGMSGSWTVKARRSRLDGQDTKVVRRLIWPTGRTGGSRSGAPRSPAHRAGYVSRPGGQAGGAPGARRSAPDESNATNAQRPHHQTRENKCARAEARAHSRIEARRGLPQRGRRTPVRRRRSQRHRGSPKGSTLPHDPGS